MKKLLTIFLIFMKIGAFTFGGGYAMIALLENEVIEKKKWIEHNEFLNMVAVAESTPGPIAINSVLILVITLPDFPVQQWLLLQYVSRLFLLFTVFPFSLSGS